ncbi:phosphoglycerate mutase family protein [archaeon]|jgi:2,3-bisphosphoglycerate-dependent phosphoglycerate mutase|nr:phosphoglycerate mutase family protein [archaeon]
MTKLKIYLFRHGQTYYNKNKIFTGWKDSKLTPTGIKQAKIIAKKLKNKKFQVAFYTRLSRSKDTLKEVLKYHPECKKLIKDDKMIERSYGTLSGMSHKKFIESMGKQKFNLMKQGDAIENLDPETRKKAKKILGKVAYDAVHRGYNTPPPKGESFAMVEKRVQKFIKDLKKFMKKEKVNVAISAHGNSIRLFRKIMEKTSKEKTIQWVIPYEDYFEYSINI